ncbi:hypothetical protein E2C01_099586 [Portunus trituberculatus]|uniref:Uncharacterized protein n=1 Tax=Portunus trituberculatus TaxID=210409 RepID=A0A5B7KBC3_PORTR|nr:hypothetical protein [Portunus trituberculatus]
MWLRESILTFLDYYLTKIDSFLLRVQDAIIAALTYLLRPVATLYRQIVPATKVLHLLHSHCTQPLTRHAQGI